MNTFAFNVACMNNNCIELVPCCTNEQLSIGFAIACENGHLELAQRMYSKNIDLSVGEYHCFTWACIHNNIEVAKWLWTLQKFPITKFTINMCKVMNSEKTLNWLLSLQYNINYTADN